MREPEPDTTPYSIPELATGATSSEAGAAEEPSEKDADMANEKRDKRDRSEKIERSEIRDRKHEGRNREGRHREGRGRYEEDRGYEEVSRRGHDSERRGRQSTYERSCSPERRKPRRRYEEERPEQPRRREARREQRSRSPRADPGAGDSDSEAAPVAEPPPKKEPKNKRVSGFDNKESSGQSFSSTPALPTQGLTATPMGGFGPGGNLASNNPSFQGPNCTSNVYFGMMPFGVTENDLRSLAAPYGTIVSSRLMSTRNGGVCGFVTYASVAEANMCINALNGAVIQRAKLKVMFADQGNLGFRRLQQQAIDSAGNSGFRLTDAGLPMPSLAPNGATFTAKI